MSLTEESTPVRVLISPDKFKGSLTATEVATAVAAGLRAVRPDVEAELLPVADGGDGTVEAALAAGYHRVPVTAVGPTGEPVDTCYAQRGGHAVVELAAVVGLDLLPGGVPDALGASTYGLGLVVDEAISRGATNIVLGVGGSASTDGGAGMLQALGARLLDTSGRELARGGAALAELASVDITELAERVDGVHFLVATDVDNPLLGPTGAAAVFGPQKGADAATVERLDAALATWARAVEEVRGDDLSTVPGAGAAGGTTFGALALLDAEVTPGIELVLDMIGFRRALENATLVVTGEGSLDEQSLSGKAPVGVSSAARASGTPVVAVAGRCLLSDDQLRAAGISAAYPLSSIEPDVATSIRDAARLLTTVGERIAHDWL
jgi:glycerate kinase